MSTTKAKRNIIMRAAAGALAVVLVYTLTVFCYRSTAAQDNYRLWKQWDERWGELELGTSGKTLAKIGCAMTAAAILIVHSGTRSELTFDPGILCEYLNDHQGFDGVGNINWYPISGLVPEFTFQGKRTFLGETQEEKTTEILDYLSLGYYLAVSVNGTSHWVAVDSVEGETVKILDPGYSARTSLFDDYEFETVTQIRLFKGLKSYGKVYETGTYLTKGSVNMRESAGTYYDVLKTIPSNTIVSVNNLSGNWGQVIYDGSIGWLHLDYATRVSSETFTGVTTTTTTAATTTETTTLTTGTTTGTLNAINTNPTEYKPGMYKVTTQFDSPLNYRSGPGTEYERLGSLPNGTAVEVVAVQGDWGKIIRDGKDAWISLQYATYTGGVTTTAPQTTVTTVPTTTTTARTTSGEPIKGDANFDGVVTLLDIVLMREHVLEVKLFTPAQIAACDMNGDGKVTLEDIMILTKMLTVGN